MLLEGSEKNLFMLKKVLRIPSYLFRIYKDLVPFGYQ